MPRPPASTPKIRRFPIPPTLGVRTRPTQIRSLPRREESPRRNGMPQVPKPKPQPGECMAEATIVSIKVQPGDKVSADQEIIEVETDKAVMGVTTPCAGEIAKIDAEVKGTYPVGAILGYVEASEADAARFQKRAPEPPKGEVAKEIPGREEEKAEAVTGNGSGSHFQVDEKGLPQVAAGSHFQVDQTGVLPVPAAAKGAGYFSPRVRARMAELQLTQADLAGIAGTGT